MGSIKGQEVKGKVVVEIVAEIAVEAAAVVV